MTDTLDEKAVEAAARTIRDALLSNGLASGSEMVVAKVAADIAITALRAARKEAGFVEVPGEPSMDVLQAGYEALCTDKWDATQAAWVGAAWDAMLAKAK